MIKTAFKISILINFFLIFSGISQTFSWQADTTSINTTPDTTSIGKAVQFNTYISNISNDTLMLRVIRFSNSLPNGWSSSLCIGFCYPPFIDSIDFSIPNVGADTLLDLIFNIDSIPNSGTVGLKVKNIIDPLDYEIKDFTVTTTPISIGKDINIFQRDFILYSTYPNPFNPATTLRYYLNNSSRQNVKLMIYNSIGQLVRTLVNTVQLGGEYQVTWDGKNQIGQPVSSGIYFYRLTVGNEQEFQKMILSR